MRRGAAVVAVVVALVATSACAGSGRAGRPTGASSTSSSAGAGSTVATTASTGAPPVTAGTPGVFSCNAAVGSTTGSLASGGLNRTYRLQVPGGLTGPAPLVLNLHGFGSNAAGQEVYSRLPSQGAARGVIVVTPDGQGSPQHWDLVAVPREADDYAFLGALLDTLEATGCVDRTRVYAAGMSNGSAMSALLACRFNARLAAVALVAATVGPIGCQPGQTMPVLSFHGTDDEIVPYSGGTIGGGGTAGGFPVGSVEDELARWAAQDGCGGEPAESSAAFDVETLDFPCPAGIAVRLYRILKGGHTWPGAADAPGLGYTTQSIDATSLMLDFFATFTRAR